MVRLIKQQVWLVWMSMYKITFLYVVFDLYSDTLYKWYDLWYDLYVTYIYRLSFVYMGLIYDLYDFLWHDFILNLDIQLNRVSYDPFILGLFICDYLFYIKNFKVFRSLLWNRPVRFTDSVNSTPFFFYLTGE